MNKLKNFFKDKVVMLMLLVIIVYIISLFSPLVRKYSPLVFLILFLLAFFYSLNALRKNWKNWSIIRTSPEIKKTLIFPEKEPDMIVRVKCNNCGYEGEASEFGVKNKAGFKFTGIFLTTQICPKCQAVRNLTCILNNHKQIEIPDYTDYGALSKRLLIEAILFLIFALAAFLYLLFKNNLQIK